MPFWRTIRGYLWWTYDRGSFHYDVMVTLILLFIFVSPHYLDFNDKPIDRVPHPTEVIVNADGHGGLVYQVSAKAVDGKTGDDLDKALLRVIEPISGEVRMVERTPVLDHGKVIAYQVRVSRP